MGNIKWQLLVPAAAASIAAAIVGSWMMHKKLEARQVKRVIGIVLYAIAAKMSWSLV